MKPKLGEHVHYVAFGTPKGEYLPMCRAAVVTEVGQWVTVDTDEGPSSFSRSEGRPIRTVEQWFFDDAAALFVMNPTGVFFNGAGPVACKHSVPAIGGALGGTWHSEAECTR